MLWNIMCYWPKTKSLACPFRAFRMNLFQTEIPSPEYYMGRTNRLVKTFRYKEHLIVRHEMTKSHRESWCLLILSNFNVCVDAHPALLSFCFSWVSVCFCLPSTTTVHHYFCNNRSPVRKCNLCLSTSSVMIFKHCFAAILILFSSTYTCWS